MRISETPLYLGRAAGDGEALEDAERLEAALGGEGGVHDDAGRGAVRELRGVPGRDGRRRVHRAAHRRQSRDLRASHVRVRQVWFFELTLRALSLSLVVVVESLATYVRTQRERERESVSLSSSSSSLSQKYVRIQREECVVWDARERERERETLSSVVPGRLHSSLVTVTSISATSPVALSVTFITVRIGTISAS